VTVFVLWSVSRHTPNSGDDGLVVECLTGWLLLAIGILIAVWMWPAANMPRRVLGMLADVGAITFALFFMGSGGAILVGTYLFLILGNGFRYGNVYLHVCQVFCLVGFALVAWSVEWWKFQAPAVVAGWMLVLITIPIYVGTLAHRLRAALWEAQQALKDCIGREARGS
jgi:two-component system sensor histidine kinase RpfC